MHYLLVIITAKSQFYGETNFFLLKGAFFFYRNVGLTLAFRYLNSFVVGLYQKKERKTKTEKTHL